MTAGGHMLKYTICFIKRGNEVLLLNREYPSWMGSWNGIGGKLDGGETPLQCVTREILEETGLRLDNVVYKGVVTWEVDGVPAGGMYTFAATVPDDLVYETPRKTAEGILDWKEIAWIMHPKNTGMATNVPKFLPKVLDDEGLYEHKCAFTRDRLEKVDSVPLPDVFRSR